MLRLPILVSLAGVTTPLVLDPRLALAYIDPGTGSFLFQTITAAVIGGVFLVRTSWNRIRAGFKRVFGPRRGD